MSVSIIELPEEQFFLFIEGETTRVMVNTSDIKTVDLPCGSSQTLTIKTWNEAYTFAGKDAELIEDFLVARSSHSWK